MFSWLSQSETVFNFACVYLYWKSFCIYKSCWGGTQIFAKALKTTSSAVRILTASGSKSLPYQCIYSKHRQNKHPGRTWFSFRSLKIIYWYRGNRHEKKTLSKSVTEDLVSQQLYCNRKIRNPSNLFYSCRLQIRFTEIEQVMKFL